MEKKRETTIVCRGCLGIMEKKMETTVLDYVRILGYILGIYWDNGKENGNYYSI